MNFYLHKQFLFFIISAKGQIAAGKYGYPGFCDSNELMVHTMFQDMVDKHGDVC